MRHHLLRTLLPVLALAALAGCLSSDDDGDTPPTEPPAFQLPDTVDSLMAVFVAVYGGRDAENYAAILHDAYTFDGPDGRSFDRAADLAICTRLFAGEEGDGGIAFEGIEIWRFDALEAWHAVPPDDPYHGGVAGAMKRAYEVRIAHKVRGENLWYVVEGPVIAYAVSADEGRYQLLGLVDQTLGNKAVENHNWTGIKELFD
jgi:hypothetical protein